MLEPCAMKVASTVLRGGGRGDTSPLPDSTITPCSPDELRFLCDRLFGELSERGFAIVDKSRLQTVFSPLIDASKSKLQEELARHRTLIAQRYGERAEEAFSQVSDLDASTVMHSFYAQRTEELELRLEKMSAQTRTNLPDKDRQELEILRSEKAFRKQRELKRKRAAESSPKKKKESLCLCLSLSLSLVKNDPI